MNNRVSHVLKKGMSILSASVACIYGALPALAAAQDAAKPGTADEPFGAGITSISKLTAAIFQFGLILCVLAASIYIAFGAYIYFLAAGNAAKAEQGKALIQRALLGLILALIAWVILNTISTQFTQLKDPQLKL